MENNKYLREEILRMSVAAGTAAITTSGTIKLKHSNVLSSSGTIGSSSASSGATLAVPYANYDINGHITSKGTHTHTINNLTSSAINSSYKLPTTTEWAGKQNTLSSTNKLSSSYISWDGDIDLSNDDSLNITLDILPAKSTAFIAF